MASLARVLLERGWTLTGSDIAACEPEWLRETGIHVWRGHRTDHLPPATDLLIHSDAVAPDNPEILRARQQNVSILSYFDMVGRMMVGSDGVAVSGTHGKSTTTAMAAWTLVHAGLEPTVVCGASTLGHTDGGRHGRGPVMLAEACEYRANFLRLAPRTAVITGIEADHFDYYRDLTAVEQAFGRFVRRVPHRGLIVARHDCVSTRRVIAGLACRVETFGVDDDADWVARPLGVGAGRYRFQVHYQGQALCEVALGVPGMHNVLNALAAAAVAHHQGVRPETIAAALGTFPGLRRRLEEVGHWQHVTLVDDYAHHPTEVSASLATLREMYPGRRLCCVFQPHQASRTARLLDELAASLHNVDRLWIADIFRAREPDMAPGDVTAADLAHATRQRGQWTARVHQPNRIGRDLKNHLAPGDVLVTIAAGNLRRILLDEFSQGLRDIRAAS